MCTHVRCFRSPALTLHPVSPHAPSRFTHRWSIEKRGIDMRPNVVDVSEPAPAPLVVAAPPATGYGTEEDSLGSVYHLVPKVPKKDVAKMVKYDGVVLRFEAVIKDASPVDRVRKFTVSWCVGVRVRMRGRRRRPRVGRCAWCRSCRAGQWHGTAAAARHAVAYPARLTVWVVCVLASVPPPRRFPENDTVAVNEPPQKNTGIIGGKFMAREKVLNPATGHYFTTEDFGVGKEVVLRGQTFVLQAADSRTAAFLASAA